MSFKTKRTEDVALYHPEVEVTQIFKLLAGLHPNYELICVQILGKDPLPPLVEGFLYLSQEEDRWHLMVQRQHPVNDFSALACSSQRRGCGSSPVAMVVKVEVEPSMMIKRN